MASTIKLKNGSGAPTTGDLVQGEPALDLTNKRLYTENASGVVIEVGTNPSTIDINAGTIDGTVIGGTTPAAITGTAITATGIMTATGTSVFASLDISGDIDVDGTTNLDVVDIDGAVDMASTLAVGGIADFADHVDLLDNKELRLGSGNDYRFDYDGSRLNVIGTGDTVFDITGDFYIDADGADVIFQDGGTSFAEHDKDGNNYRIKNPISDGNILIQGTDSASIITALTLDMSAAGAATFNNNVILPDNGYFLFGDTTSGIQGNSSSDFIKFYTANTERFRIASNGDISFYEDTGTTAKLFWDASEERLGIGTTSPSVHLDVEGTAQVNLLEVTHDGDRAVNFVRTGANTFSIEHDITQFYFWNQTTSESPLLFQNDGDVIMNGGNVGIGTSSPTGAKLQVVAESGSNVLGVGTTTQGLFIKTTGTTVDYNSSGNSAGEHTFSTGNTERMRLNASGNLLVGTTDTVIWNDTSGEGVVIGPNAIQVARASDVCLLLNRQSTDGVVQAFASRGVQVGDITVSVSSTAYNTSSDQRLKENITDANDAGDKIDAIKVRQYDWKADGSHQDYGMVAQELMTVAPEAVSVPEDPEKMMGVDYSKLVPMLIKEVQSLRARVAQLEGAN
jgi:hypothetical protein